MISPKKPLLLVVLLAGVLSGCTGESPGPPPPVDELSPKTALWPQVEQFRADLEAVRHPSDGGGRALIEEDGAPLAPGTCATLGFGQPGSWQLQFEVGEHGIAKGGSIFLMPEPYWGWSTPQVRFAEGAGYTTVETDAAGVQFELVSLGSSSAGLLQARVLDAPLEAGAIVRFHYGAGPAGVRGDRYAERGSRLWFAVDGDGDGVRKVVEDSPCVDVLPGPASRMAVHIPSSGSVGESLRVTIAMLDLAGNRATDFVGEVQLSCSTTARVLDLPDTVTLTPDHQGCVTLTVPVAAATDEVVRISAVAADMARASSNPMLLDGRAVRVLWADLHGHSGFSDGTGPPEDYFRYARDVAALDIVALTDHDHFGVLFLDQHPEMWDEIRAQVKAFHEPGRFVTLLGYEWTSWIHGHRHVIWFEEDGEIYSSLDPATETPRQLWSALAGRDVLTFAHHSAGNPIPNNWSFAPDPVLEPVTEVMSVHGSSEAPDSPSRVQGARPGYYVRDALDRGYKLGFIGSGDSHDGHPGLAHLGPSYGWQAGTSRRAERMGTGGVAAIIAEDLTRASVLKAIRARSVYATSGPRIILFADVAGHRLGSTVSAAELAAETTLTLEVHGTAAIERIDVIRSGDVVASLPLSEHDALVSLPLPDLGTGEYVYVRVLQSDGALAWSSPLYVEGP